MRCFSQTASPQKAQQNHVLDFSGPSQTEHLFLFAIFVSGLKSCSSSSPKISPMFIHKVLRKIVKKNGKQYYVDYNSTITICKFSFWLHRNTQQKYIFASCHLGVRTTQHAFFWVKIVKNNEKTILSTLQFTIIIFKFSFWFHRNTKQKYISTLSFWGYEYSACIFMKWNCWHQFRNKIRNVWKNQRL